MKLTLKVRRLTESGMMIALATAISFVCSLIPVPPFDGSRVAFVFLPAKYYFGVMKYERQIMFGVLIGLMVLSRLGFSPFSWIAEQLTALISTPVARVSMKLLSSI